MLQSDPGPAAHFPVSALATRWGLGGALGFVPLKASRMGGTTTGNIMPVKPMKQLHITTGSRCMAT